MPNSLHRVQTQGDTYTASVLVLQAILQGDSFCSWKCSQGVDTDFRVQTMKLLRIEHNSAYKASGIRAEKSVTPVTQHRQMNKTEIQRRIMTVKVSIFRI